MCENGVDGFETLDGRPAPHQCTLPPCTVEGYQREFGRESSCQRHWDLGTRDQEASLGDPRPGFCHQGVLSLIQPVLPDGIISLTDPMLRIGLLPFSHSRRASLWSMLIIHRRAVVLILTPLLAGIVAWLTGIFAVRQSFDTVNYGLPFAWKTVTTRFACARGLELSFCVPIGFSIGYNWVSFIGDIGFYVAIGYGIAFLRSPYRTARQTVVFFRRRVAQFIEPTWGQMNLALKLSTGLSLLSGILFLVGTAWYAPIFSIIFEFDGVTFCFVCALISCTGAILLLLSPMKIETQGIAGFIMFLASLPTILSVLLFASLLMGLARVS
jgi:hypothetical protein